MSFVPVEKYGEIYSVGSGIWCVDGEWKNTSFRRRMTILADRERNLAIHNPFYLHKADYEKVASLGRVRWVLAPNRFHCSEVRGFLATFPQAELHASPAAAKTLKRTFLPLPNSFHCSDIYAKEVGGTRGLEETLFFHPESRSLVVTDLVFHALEGKNRLEQAFFRVNGLNKFGPSRIFKFLFTRNEEKLLRSIKEILAWDFDQLIMNHGKIVKQDAKKMLKDSFAKRFPKHARLLS